MIDRPASNRRRSTTTCDRRGFLRQVAAGLLLGTGGIALSPDRADAHGAHRISGVTMEPFEQSRRGPTDAPAGITHRRVRANGIGIHIAEAGTGPLIVLVHGWPELWYSWRHQLPVLAEAGFHAVAPDLRGYGESDPSETDEGYALSNLAADAVGLLDALGVERAVLVGHDWGANIAWACAELYPERVAAVVALSVPYHTRPPVSPTEARRQFAPEKANGSPYPLGLTEAELDADVRRSLRRLLFALSAEAPPDLVPRLFTERPASRGVLDSMPEPAQLPRWLSDADLDQYAQAYARTGFWGPLGMYRNQDRDWEQHPEIGTTGVKQPVLFIGGRRDSAVLFGKLEPMEAAVPNLQKIVLLPNCGHWTQQERPLDVNGELLDFLHREGWS
jgi:pimeloyl-ACP methyl ester carboxylesterase